MAFRTPHDRQHARAASRGRRGRRPKPRASAARIAVALVETVVTLARAFVRRATTRRSIPAPA